MKPNMSAATPMGLDEEYIIPIARELALALKFIHEAGVLHRDLKCQNILVLEDGRVQLCDFGVSNFHEPSIAKRSTIVGTPYWMAPELQKEWVKDVDPSSRARPNQILYGSEVDIWAYGCTIFEMATGYPPHHRVAQFELTKANTPRLEGEFSDELRSLVAFVLEAKPQDRPSPDDILDHSLLAGSTEEFPNSMLVQLIERYIRWEQGGGARVSLFNPYGAQAPDPLAPEAKDDDDDWTFSTSEGFEKQVAGDQPDPFQDLSGDQGFNASAPPDLNDRLAQLQQKMKEAAISRGKKTLDRLFDKDATPYKYHAAGSDRPPSDLILRDFNPGAPNRETVIDLDFAAPTGSDGPCIDLGEVPTLKAGRNKLLREMEEEDQADSFEQHTAVRRATREWKFPAMPERPNRRTVEWTFDIGMAEANYESPPLPQDQQTRNRRLTKDAHLPVLTAPAEVRRRTRDFVFPARDPSDSSVSDEGPELLSSPSRDSMFRLGLRHVATEPIRPFGELYPSSAPDSPMRTSLIDLDIAAVHENRPSTASSASTSVFTAGTEVTNGNPFDLEDQVHVSQTSNRGSYHMKTQSEPAHAIAGLLTPDEFDEDSEHGLEQTSNHYSSLSSISQAAAQMSSGGAGFARPRAIQPPLDRWNHANAYGIDESPPTLSATAMLDDEEPVDELWDAFERQLTQAGHDFDPLAPEPLSDADTYQNGSALVDSLNEPGRLARSQVSVGVNGKPVVDFPVPRGPDPEALQLDADASVMEDALLKSCFELRDGVRATRNLLRTMKCAEVGGASSAARGENGVDPDGLGAAANKFRLY